MEHSQALIVVANIFVCIFGGVLCVCRMAKMNSRVKFAIQVQYASLFAMFAASLLSFTYGQPATIVQVLMGVVTACHLLIGITPWRHGPPDYALKSRMTMT